MYIVSGALLVCSRWGSIMCIVSGVLLVSSQWDSICV